MTQEKYYYAIGRRKTAVATVRLFEKSGISMLNSKPLTDIYTREYDQKRLMAPFSIAGLNPKDYHITVVAKGSGPSGQLDAIKLGVARALVKMNAELRSPLKKAGLLTRDSRMVERKKPGFIKARKVEQFSKR